MHIDSPASRERRLQKLVTAYILTGLFFLLLPGTFLGVWNLIAISSEETLAGISAAWLQAHGHAQIFGWIGTFILGIGFYSLSKMGGLAPVSVFSGWICLVLWTAGAFLRWGSTIARWRWRILLPAASLLETIAFLIFFRMISRHRPLASSSGARAPREPALREPWMLAVTGSAIGLLAALVTNLILTFYFAWQDVGPALPHEIDQRVLILDAWAFLVPMVLGFNSRWLPVFIGLKPARAPGLLTAVALAWLAAIAALAGYLAVSVALMPVAAAFAIEALHIWEPARQPAKIRGVHRSFPAFVRGAYLWLSISALLSLFAFTLDRHGGIWGASRHALTVGFLSTMVFAIGQRVLPACCGMKILFSERAMFASLMLLNAGCALRVGAEIPAYEHNLQIAWSVLPVSAILEMTAVIAFVLNLVLTFADVRSRRRAVVSSVRQ